MFAVFSFVFSGHVEVDFHGDVSRDRYVSVRFFGVVFGFFEEYLYSFERELFQLAFGRVFFRHVLLGESGYINGVEGGQLSRFPVR